MEKLRAARKMLHAAIRRRIDLQGGRYAVGYRCHPVYSLAAWIPCHPGGRGTHPPFARHRNHCYCVSVDHRPSSALERCRGKIAAVSHESRWSHGLMVDGLLSAGADGGKEQHGYTGKTSACSPWRGITPGVARPPDMSQNQPARPMRVPAAVSGKHAWQAPDNSRHRAAPRDFKTSPQFLAWHANITIRM